MAHEILAALCSALLLLPIFENGLSPSPPSSDREMAGYVGPVRHVDTQFEMLSRKLYRESDTGQRELIEDSTGQFGHGRFLKAEEEFDENGRRVADASSDREVEDEPFRCVYRYDTNGRLSEADHFNRDGSPAGKKVYVYDSAGKKSEEIFYAASGVLLSKVRYDEHQNTTEVETFGPDGSVIHKQATPHSYLREGNTLIDSYNLPELPSGMYLRAFSPQKEELGDSARNPPQQLRNVYTYNDSGQLIKEVTAGWEKTYDSKGRLSVEIFGSARTTYSYDEEGRVTERLVAEPAGPYSISGGHGRYVYKYDSHGNLKEQIVYNRDESVSMRYLYTYEYDSHNNWTKRVEEEKVFNFRKDITPSTLEILTVEYRAISYY